MVKEPGWYLLYTKSKHEKKISALLNQKEIPSFLPLNKVLKQWHDRKKMIEEPLFPCYLFVFIETSYKYFECLECNGVLAFVRLGKQIAQVKESLIRQLKSIVENVRDIEISYRNYQSGQSVTITSGPLAGVSGIVVASDSQNKILVKVELLNRSLVVNYPEECLSNLVN